MAQKAVVERMEQIPFDLSGKKFQRLDLNGEPCALVKVEAIADGLEFSGNVLPPVEHKTGEYWVYLTKGSKMLRIKSPDFLPLMLNFSDYGITALEPAVTYVLTLSLPTAETVARGDTRQYPLQLTVSPASAGVTVDRTALHVRDGRAETMLYNGSHTLRVEAPGYHPQETSFSINGTPVQRLINLLPADSTLCCDTSTSSPGYYFPYDLFQADGKWGFRDSETGETVIPAKYESIGLESEGLAPVKLNGKWGFIDKGDRMVIEPQYDYALSFSEGLAQVRNDGKCGFIDRKGNLVIPLAYDEVGDFHDGLASVSIKGKQGFIDRNNQTVIPARYDWDMWNSSQSYFSEGIAPVKINGKWGYIDKNDSIVIKPVFNIAFSFSEGLALVKSGYSYGFMNRSGEMVVPAEYDVACSFSEGLAAVKKNGKWGYIDRTGRIVIPAIYFNASPFRNGRANVYLDTTYYLDRNGERRIRRLH